MPQIIYALDSAIDDFFSGAGVLSSRLHCDEAARKRCGGEIRPVDIQGMNSYTVFAGPGGNKIVQFRKKTALLDMQMIALAKDAHKEVVAGCSEIEWVGNPNGSQLAMYEMYRLPGESYITARPPFTYDQHLNTVHSLASFFAQSWLKGTPLEARLWLVFATRVECQVRFEYLNRALPERFLPVLTEIQAGLPALLDGSYPMVLTHSDLNEMNILVNPSSGKITGVVDWPDASILPFGFSLYALENALGSMGPNGWKWLDNADDLRSEFWKAFGEQTGLSEPQTRLIKLAGKAGILIRYGTAYGSGFSGMLGVRDPDDEDFGYLDALLL